MYSIHYSVFTVQCKVCMVHYIVDPLHGSLKCAIPTLQGSMNILNCAIYTLSFSLYSGECAVPTLQRPFYVCILCTIQCTVNSLHRVCTKHSKLFSAQCSLCSDPLLKCHPRLLPLHTLLFSHASLLRCRCIVMYCERY